MPFQIETVARPTKKAQALIIGAFGGEKVSLAAWKDTEEKKRITKFGSFSNFKAGVGEIYHSQLNSGEELFIVGLGPKAKAGAETVRKAVAKGLKAAQSSLSDGQAIRVAYDTFDIAKYSNEFLNAAMEASALTFYSFQLYKEKPSVKNIDVLIHIENKKLHSSAKKLAPKVHNIGSSVEITRDFVNEPPNILHSESYAKRIEQDVRKNLKGVKIKVLGKPELKKEKMNLFLSVNAASAKGPRLVHLTYTPKKKTSKMRHLAMVGKGITFDTGGYSVKPGSAMMGMKFDMGGSATVYGAFRAAVLNECPHKLTCIVALTDNAISATGTFPDSIIKTRSGKTVEILNTDAEGRLIMADAFDYACDLKPEVLIDAATLTGACLVALGTEVAAVFANDQKLADSLLSSAKACDEYAWQMPIIDEYRGQMKSKIADLKNIGSGRFAGSATAAAFLENFIHEGVKWAHFDIAGVASDQSHLPYCPTNGGSGLIVRTLHHYLMNA